LPKTEAEWAAAERALLPLLLREWPPVDTTKPLAKASEFEREQVCAWYVRSATVAVSLFNQRSSWSFSGLQLEDEQAHAIRLLALDECVKQFPSCDGSIGAARRCITRHLEHFWNREETCQADCVWGIK
jgi:hypothetical protein